MIDCACYGLKCQRLERAAGLRPSKPPNERVPKDSGNEQNAQAPQETRPKPPTKAHLPKGPGMDFDAVGYHLMSLAPSCSMMVTSTAIIHKHK